MKNFNDLIKLSKNIKERRIVVVNPANKSTLKALYEASLIMPIKSVLVGPKDNILTAIKENKVDLKNYEIINVEKEEEIAKKAISLIRTNKADILMKGLIGTRSLLKAVVNKDDGIIKDKLLSHISVFSFSRYHKLLYASDCAMIVKPTYEQKILMIDNLMKLFNKIEVHNPKIGIISAVEKVNPKIPSSVEANKLKLYYQNIKDKNYLVDGPFAIDNIFSLEAIKIKNIKSEVAGNADALIFPDINAGNVFYKTAIYLADAIVAGIVLGAKAPIVLTSRADSLKTKYYSILLAGVYSNESKNTSN